MYACSKRSDKKALMRNLISVFAARLNDNYQSREKGKDQESIQSRTIHDPEHYLGK